MRNGWSRVCLVFVATLTSLHALAETPNWNLAIPLPDLEKLITSDADLVRKAIADGLDEKKIQARAKVLAIMIAGYAQAAMVADKAKAAQFATVRDQAIHLADAIAGGKGPEAKALAAELSASMAHTGASNTSVIDLAQHIDLDDLMSQYKPELKTGGGRGLEKRLKAMIAKRSTLVGGELKEAAQLGYLSAVIGQFTEALGPTADEGKKKKADWHKWAREMSEQGAVLGKAASAAKSDDRTIRATLRRLDETCVKCHTVFRD